MPSDGFPSDLLVDLRRSNGRGLREQLEHGLRSAIQDGRLAPGSALPASRVLAAELAISRSAVTEAYGNLQAAGYLEARRGAGTRVRHDARRPAAPAAAPGRPLDLAGFFTRPRETLRRPDGPLRLLGGLPDPALFPRERWGRHYRAALAEAPDADVTYPDVFGATALRTALDAYLGRVRGVDTVPERLLVCAGITQGLTLTCRALGRAGVRRIAVEDPCFAVHRRAIAMTGLEPVPIPSGEHGLDPDLLDEANVGAVVVTPAHSYPAGGTLTPARRHALLDWARRRDAVIVEDDYDAELRYDRTPIGALQGHAPDRVVYLGSASKTVSPALRLGWLAAPAGLVDAIADEKHVDDMGSTLFEQLAFARFLAAGDFTRHLRRIRPVYRARRDATARAVAELLPDARPRGADAGLHLFVALPEAIDERAAAAAALERGLLVETGARHWADRARGEPSIVLGYGALTEPAIPRVIAALAEAVAISSAPGPRSGRPRSTG